MTEHELELLYIIRTHDDPATALKVATETIISFLERPESCREPSPADVLVPA